MSIRAIALIVVLLTALAPINKAIAWPWSDSSKYRNECRQACIEDSFGKARAVEISQRCSNKCDSLPISPRDEWNRYESCLARKAEQNSAIDTYERIRPGCEREEKELIDKKYLNCRKSKFSDEHSCQEDARKDYINDLSLDCRKKGQAARMVIYEREIFNPVCDKPNAPKPK